MTDDFNPVTIGDRTLYFGASNPQDAFFLIKNFHYSRRMPSNIQHCFVLREPGGLFGEHGNIVAACMFSVPPTRWGEDVLELSRLVRDENTKVKLTSLISKSVKFLKKTKHDLLVSFADPTHGHHGGIYQASSWCFAYKNDPRQDGIYVDGKFFPGRSCNSRWGTRSPTKLAALLPTKMVAAHYDEGKFLYWKALSKSGRKKAMRLGLKHLPYPKPNQGPLHG